MLDNATPPHLVSRIRQHPDDTFDIAIWTSTCAKVRAASDGICNISPRTTPIQNVSTDAPRPLKKSGEEAILLLLLCVAELHEVESGPLESGNEEGGERGRVGAEVWENSAEVVKE